MRHLHGRGYKRIAFIGGTTNRDTRGAARREGYEMAMRQLGLAENRVISFGTPPISMKQGGEAIVRLLEQWPEAEAAICVSDLSAFGALMAQPPPRNRDNHHRLRSYSVRKYMRSKGNLDLHGAAAVERQVKSTHGLVHRDHRGEQRREVDAAIIDQLNRKCKLFMKTE